jgi:two-component system, sensor histidine kinase and response regulator
MKIAAREPVRFLLVDDLDENLVALEALLRREGLECIRARSGEEALEALLANDIALAIVDVQMPGMDGYELAEIMRDTPRTKTIPIILVTADAYEALKPFHGYEAGAVDFLVKPIEPRILKSKANTFFELAVQRRRLEESIALNDMFVAALSHDLRNPLSAIVSGAAILAHTNDESTKRVVDRVRSAANRMTRMIEQLFDLSRVRVGGGLELVTQHADLGDVAKRIAAEHHLGGATIAVECSGDTAGQWDDVRLGQVVANLVGNALKHGRPPVIVRVDGSAAPRVVLSVTNQGTIPDEIRPYVFDPFRSGRERSTDGLGLGLFIVQEIVHAHGGDLRIASPPGADETTFEAVLPRSS